MTRIVTLQAEGTPAMLLPPQTFAAVDGLKLYHAQPALENKADGRTNAPVVARILAALEQTLMHHLVQQGVVGERAKTLKRPSWSVPDTITAFVSSSVGQR